MIMKNPIKKVAAINDLSGFGRAALTTIIPILSTMGIQVCPFPTAILSTHTGGFEDCSFVDLTDSLRGYMEHWKNEKIEFDCIYSGFLGSATQVDIIIDFIVDFKSDSNMVVVDPVMGDNGKLYSTMDDNMVSKMRDLVKKADIITPNLTEALYLLGKEHTNTIDEEQVKRMMIELANFGPRIVVITSVPDDILPENINVLAYDKRNNKFYKVTSERIPIDFPGTGDTFTSVLIGKILNGDDLSKALEESVEFVSIGIKESIAFSYPRREGILLEKVLGKLKTSE